MDKYGFLAVDTTSVSPGGYIMGGGVGPVTRMLGLGVDQVLEFTIVTADWSTVTVVQPNTQPGSKGTSFRTCLLKGRLLLYDK